ncbi:terminase small subunit [Planococcus halocryophilus]|uniref:terminase small subunit n=1 Tax=Planococcus halocryophilus TaxID=1215089 RepID=UPI001F10068C|nr:terminase small subunit [Planococcus halocryophilus]MCH4825769.1 terminase small subunit [Planococcus halocryophilus]
MENDIGLNKEAKTTKEKYGLNERQLTFCELYLQNGNATKSYMISYETDNTNTAAVNGSNLLKKENITKMIADGKKKLLSQNRILSEEDILKFWSTTVSNPEYKINDRMKASELLAKNKGMLNDKIDITHDVEINLGFDPAALIESSTNQIIEQKNKAIKHDDYYEADYDDVNED